MELGSNSHDGNYIYLKHNTDDKRDYLFQGKKQSDHEEWVQIITKNIAKCVPEPGGENLRKEPSKRRFSQHKRRKEKTSAPHQHVETMDLPEGRIFGVHLRELERNEKNFAPQFVVDCVTYLSNFCE